jgi:PadR family transcriptional regulator PadR
MRPDVVRGHLDGLILAILERGQRHGFAIITELQLASGGRLDLPTGTVYPALHRLERNGLIAGEWDETSGRRRRTYRLTAAGSTDLTRVRTEWREFSTTVGGLLGSTS